MRRLCLGGAAPTREKCGCRRRRTNAWHGWTSTFLDESGFPLVPSVRGTWAARAKTPLVSHRYSHDRISAISTVTVSPQRRRLGFYCHFHLDNPI